MRSHRMPFTSTKPLMFAVRSQHKTDVDLNAARSKILADWYQEARESKDAMLKHE